MFFLFFSNVECESEIYIFLLFWCRGFFCLYFKNKINNWLFFFVVRFKNKVCFFKFYMCVNNFDRFIKWFLFEIYLNWFVLKGCNWKDENILFCCFVICLVDI